MWFQGKSKDKQSGIECPYCGLAQVVSDTISAVFCKGCKKTIFRNASGEAILAQPLSSPGRNPASDPGTVPPPASPEKKSPAPSPGPVSPGGGSASHARTPMPKNLAEEKEKTGEPLVPKSHSFVSTPVTGPEPVSRKVRCPHCKTHQEVPTIAVQSFCEQCAQRINLQDYRIEKGNFKGDLETRGEVCVAEGSRVKANLNVGTALIRGTIEGKIIAEKKVELFPNSLVIGTIESPVLIVHEGGGFVGRALVGDVGDQTGDQSGSDSKERRLRPA